jgi:DNA modification methylase
MSDWRILTGDVRERLRELPDGSVQTCVTSPPYWGLRDYGIDGQIGSEESPEEWTAVLIDVFREVRRVLASGGTLWCNLGDAYGSGTRASRDYSHTTKHGYWTNPGIDKRLPSPAKQLIGLPWRLAFALQADGWYLRSDIIWNKPNPMPESVTDRPTKAHEMIFLLTKSARYFYDADAIREGVSETGIVAGADGDGQGSVFSDNLGLESASPLSLLQICVRLSATIFDIAERQNNVGLLPLDTEIGQQGTDGCTRLTVVHIPIMRRASAQATRFADGDISAKEFLKEIHSLCVALPDSNDLKKAWRLAALHIGHVATDSDRSVTIHNASEVGQFQFIHTSNTTTRVPSLHMSGTQRNDGDRWRTVDGGVAARGTRNKRSVWTVATQPYPDAHFATFPEALIEPCILAGSKPGDTVLDPFCGSGTTGAVSVRHQRDFIGIELNPAYVQLARRRIGAVAPLFSTEQTA